MGRMSSKRTPGAGKSGNCRRDCCSFTLRRGSSAVLEEEELVNPSGCSTLGSALLWLLDGEGREVRSRGVGLEGRRQWQRPQRPATEVEAGSWKLEESCS